MCGTAPECRESCTMANDKIAFHTFVSEPRTFSPYCSEYDDGPLKATQPAALFFPHYDGYLRVALYTMAVLV